MKRLGTVGVSASLAVLMGLAAPAQAHHGWGCTAMSRSNSPALSKRQIWAVRMDS